MPDDPKSKDAEMRKLSEQFPPEEIAKLNEATRARFQDAILRIRLNFRSLGGRQ